MFIFGHAGITLGAALLINGVIGKRFKSVDAGNDTAEIASPSDDDSDRSWFGSLGQRLDIRILLLGSLLPDIIDKPIGRFFLSDVFENGRIFGHTLLFAIIITIAGWYVYRRWKKTSLLALSFGIVTHIVLDRMWNYHQTLFWPLFGFTFEKYNYDFWSWSTMEHRLERLVDNPFLGIPELIGVIIFVWFTVYLVRNRKLKVFLRYGRI